MATYAAFKHVELYNVGKTKKRVLRPPGGGSSDIFGSDIPSTPRSVKNHMQSNIFSCEKGLVKNNCEQQRRGQKNTDSYTRLFGDPERPFTPAKNHMKSSIPFGGTAASENGNGNAAANGNGVHSSHAKVGKSENGGSSSSASSVSSSTENLKMNGLSKTEIEENSIASSPRRFVENSKQIDKIGDKDGLSARSSASKEFEKNNGEVTSIKAASYSEDTSSEVTTSTLSSQKTASAISGSHKSTPRNPITGWGLGNNQRTRRSVNRKETEEIGDDQKTPKATTLCTDRKYEQLAASDEFSAMNSPQMNVKTRNDLSPRPIDASNFENDKSQILVGSFVSQNTASATDVTKEQTPRNPITGCGLGEHGQIFRRNNNRRDGNPVTGEGYKQTGGEVNTTIPTLNGANQVINKNRVPPGGFSSGLW